MPCLAVHWVQHLQHAHSQQQVEQQRCGLLTPAVVAAAFIVGLGALAAQHTPDQDATRRAIAGHSVSALFFLWRYSVRLRREAEESEESDD